jgi:hypothetical protein
VSSPSIWILPHFQTIHWLSLYSGSVLNFTDETHHCTKSLTTSSALNLFPLRASECIEQVKIAWRQFRTIGGVWQYFLRHFPQCSCCHRGGVRTRVLVEETDASDWSTSSFWKKGWFYSDFKKLWIISCTIRKWMNKKPWEYQRTLSLTFLTEGVVFTCFHAVFGRLKMTYSSHTRGSFGAVRHQPQQVLRFLWIEM